MKTKLPEQMTKQPILLILLAIYGVWVFLSRKTQLRQYLTAIPVAVLATE